jgi:hypothetical protein
LYKDLLYEFISLPLYLGSFSGITKWRNPCTALSYKTSSRRLYRDIKSAIEAVCCEVNKSYNNDGGSRRYYSSLNLLGEGADYKGNHIYKLCEACNNNVIGLLHQLFE